MSGLAKCSVCGNLAVWDYAPADGIGEYCDDHVPRGCSCNRSFNQETDEWDGPEDTDERGRLLPCCEYWFAPEGFEQTDPAEVEEYRRRSAQWLEQQRTASGMDARSGETGTGSTEGDGPTAAPSGGDAQTPPPSERGSGD